MRVPAAVRAAVELGRGWDRRGLPRSGELAAGSGSSPSISRKV